THDSFPHETTADQFFSESQFESYRALGEMTIREMTDMYGKPLANACDLIDAARQYVSRKDDEPAPAVAGQCDYQRQLKPTETRPSSTPV
ncbi:MAG TPA: hypothetical protein VGR95_20030, partial [Thermoanaerobaculia bacterium]|nr:hypothetical protein [Thermoanaerobaculia bacterium]